MLRGEPAVVGVSAVGAASDRVHRGLQCDDATVSVTMSMKKRKIRREFIWKFD
jgi:hypothetical protein